MKRLLTGHFAPKSVGLRVFAASSAYRYGIPRDTNLIADLRCEEDKSYLTLGTGCIGGRHRAVHVAEQLVERRAAGLQADLAHCDLLVSGSPPSVQAGAPVTEN